jgi:hypothetical protein
MGYKLENKVKILRFFQIFRTLKFENKVQVLRFLGLLQKIDTENFNSFEKSRYQEKIKEKITIF